MSYISKKLTLEEIKIRLKEINPNIEIISNKYINNKTKLKFKCLADGCNYIGNMNWTHLRDGHGCKKCSLDKIRKLYSIPKNGNSVFEMRPDLYKFFYNKDECHNYSVFSGFKIQCICPICGKLKDKKIKILDLSKQGFSCGYCSDGISIPEKFMRNVLKQINVDFTVQYSPYWANKKRYDFYIPSLNIIIETHGAQHYEGGRGFYKSTIDESENDKLKYTIAIKNGINIENYIITDCRKSEFEWLKENCIKSLEKHFDLSKINWIFVWEKCQNSIIYEVCDMYNLGDSKIDISENLKISTATVSRYLKIGMEINMI